MKPTCKCCLHRFLETSDSKFAFKMIYSGNNERNQSSYWALGYRNQRIKIQSDIYVPAELIFCQ